MNHSGDAAEQIVRISLEGVEVAARITGSAAKEIALLLIAALKNNENNLKLKGKARLTSMLKSGKPLEIFSLKERDLANFAQGAKQYGMVYCVLRSIKNSPDGLCDIMVKADDAPKISRLVERFKFATVDKAKIESEIAAEKTEIAERATDPTSDPTTEATAKTEPGAVPEVSEVQDARDISDTEKLLDELLGTTEGKAEPDKPEPEKMEPTKTAPEKTVPVKTVSVKAEPAKARQAKYEPVETEPAKTGKEQTDSLPFSRGGLPEPLPSAPTSDSKSKPGRATLSRPSVKEELREIAAAKKAKEKEADAPKNGERQASDKSKNVQAANTHKQLRSGKSKSKKT
jgi:hypothetical protein